MNWIRIVRLHEKIKNQRLDFYQKIENKVAENYDLITFEVLSLRDMKNKLYSRKINDLGYHNFKEYYNIKYMGIDRYFIKLIDIFRPLRTVQSVET